jgi:hypothetical protein
MRALLLTAIGIGVPACGAGYGDGGYGAPVSNAPPPGQGAGVGGATLRVKNFLNWCSIEINGGIASTDATVTASVAPGSAATIVATTNPCP